MSKEYSDQEIEEILDTQAQKMNRVFIRILHSIGEREVLAIIAMILIFIGVLVFIYAMEREQ